MITSVDLNDMQTPRVRDYLPRFRAAPPPDPDRGDWTAWQDLLASDESDPAASPRGAMNFATESGFATVSSALIALPTVGRRGIHPLFRFTARRPNVSPWHETKV